MMKSMIFIFKMYPLLINLILLIVLSIPSKLNKLNPFNFLLMLIMFTLMMSLKINYFMKSWSSYILFLIMIGGLLIIFMYIVSLINNEMSIFNLKLIFMSLFKLIPLILLIIMMFFLFSNFEMNDLYMNNLLKINNLNFYELFMKFYKFNNLFIINYLFYSLICIMNICYKFKSPLRQLIF